MGLRQAAHGLTGDEVLASLHRIGFCIDAIVQGGRLNGAWANGVAANALGHIVGGHAFGEPNDSGS